MRIERSGAAGLFQTASTNFQTQFDSESEYSLEACLRIFKAFLSYLQDLPGGYFEDNTSYRLLCDFVNTGDENVFIELSSKIHIDPINLSQRFDRLPPDEQVNAVIEFHKVRDFCGEYDRAHHLSNDAVGP